MENIPLKIGTSAFKTESLTGKNVEINYKSGGRYKGDVVDNRKCGKGSMYWPDGSVYHGDFVNDQRSGKGHQFYRDKSSYEGQFANDKRNGYGIQKFPNGEVYEGHFFQDLRHGVGKYAWPENCEYSGLFYANNKEGYGTLTFTNGNVFQGLYKDDKREGPGILTYKDRNLQDVGLWYGLRLIRISCKMTQVFSLSEHPHYQYYKPEIPVITSADTWSSHSLLKDLSNICDYSSDISEKIKDIYLEYPDCCNVKINHELFNKVFVQQASGQIDLQCTCKLWNVTPFLEDLQKHILKHSFNQTLINVDNILNNNRHCFYPEGPLENISEQLLWASAYGKSEVVENILNEDIIHPDVAGRDGNTALINATAIGNCEIINSLLNHGANINQLNDEGCSALAVGFVLCYSAESLHMNLLCDNCGHLPSIAMDTEENAVSESQPSQVMASGDNGHSLTNAPNATSVLIERTNSMELESLDDWQNASPRNLFSAADIDSGISRSSQVCQGNRQSRIYLEKEHSSSPHQKSFLKYREKNSQGRLSRLESRVESRRVYSYLDAANVSTRYTENSLANRISELKPMELKNSLTDLPNIQHEVMARESLVPRNSYASPSRLDSVNRSLSSSSWRKSSKVSDWMNTTNFQKAEHSRKKILQTAYEESNIKKETDEFTRSFVKKMSRNFLPVENSELYTKFMPSHQSQYKDKIFVVRKNCFQECVDFLLKRGADPNSSSCPWPVLFIAVRALDVPMVKTLLLKGAFANATLPKEAGCLVPLHIACSYPGKEGNQAAELLLNSLADPDARMTLDNSYLDSAQMAGCQDDTLDKTSWTLSGGRTPLHIACGHEEHLEDAAKMVRLLLDNRANPNLLCNGLSPLAVAIAHGNISAVDELIAYGADPNLPLAHGVGSALCMCVLSQFKGKLSTYTTVKLMNKLVKAGASILTKIPIGPKKILGNIVDFCYDLFYQDYRISHIPPHALTVAERETYKTRKEILAHVGSLLREAIIDKERQKLKDNTSEERKDSSQKSKFMFTGVNQGKTKKSEAKNVTFDFPEDTYQKSAVYSMDHNQTWTLLDFCYDCGRSMSVKLKPCTRCKAVSFCSKACKIKAWTTRHRYECMRIKDRKDLLKSNRKESTLPFNSIQSVIESKRSPLPALKEPKYRPRKLLLLTPEARKLFLRRKQQQQHHSQKTTALNEERKSSGKNLNKGSTESEIKNIPRG